jgi:hypothetical protein
MSVVRWPGEGWIAHRSQQGLRGRSLVLGPLQINWYTGLRVYVTWPVPLCIHGKGKVTA